MSYKTDLSFSGKYYMTCDIDTFLHVAVSNLLQMDFIYLVFAAPVLLLTETS